MRIGASRPHRRDQVSALLAAACAPAHPSELAGEEAAVAAYRAAGDAPPSPALANRKTARRLTAGVATWLAAVTATAAVGAAVAAAAVNREPPAARPGDQPPASAVAPPVKSPAADPAQLRDRVGPGISDGAPSGAPAGSGADVPAQLMGLCRAYLAKKPAQRAKALENRGFEQLVLAAGGVDQVPTYCDAVLASAAGNGAAPAPARTDEPRATPPPKPPKPPKPTKTKEPTKEK